MRMHNTAGFSDMMTVLQKLHLIETVDHAALHPNGPDITWVSTRRLCVIYFVVYDEIIFFF